MAQLLDNDLLDHALKYAAKGWPVLPIRAGTKIPHTMRGLKDASTDARTISAWWRRWPDASIGITTGPESGLAVIDIDAGKGEASVNELELPMPPTLTCRTGGGGRHLYYAYTPGFKNSQSRLAKGIDTRGDGGYVVAPPSVHQSGNAYEWIDENAEIAELPRWAKPSNLDDLPPIPSPAPTSDSYERCRKYLEKIPDSISGQRGHDMALRAACECFRFGLSESQAWDLLQWFNASKCQPAWSERELWHKLSDGRKKVETEGKFGMRLKGGNELADWPVSFTIDMSDPEPPAAPKPNGGFPADLLDPPGTVGEICRWINDTAIKPQPILTLANALAFFGAVVGRKVATPTDLRTNLYCLGVAESGAGKDHSRKAVKRICEAAGLTAQILGGEEVSSDTAILNAVYARPSILFQFDEIGHFLANASSKYAATHLKNVAPTFTKLFSSANTTAIGKEYAGAERKDIVQPNVCLYGTTVPSRLYDGLTPGEIADGFLGRMLVFQSDDADPMEREVEISEVPESIITSVQSWFQRTDLPRAAGNLAAATIHIPIQVRFEPDAIAEIQRFRARCRTEKARVRELGTGLDVLWSRAVEHACKVALTIAAGCTYVEPIVSGDVAAFGVRLVEHLVGQLVVTVGDSVAGTDHERDVIFVQKVIARAGAKGITNTELVQRTRRLRQQARHDILSQLLTSDTIIKGERKNPRGSPTTIYVLRK